MYITKLRIGASPRLEKKLTRYPQFSSRISFVHVPGRRGGKAVRGRLDTPPLTELFFPACWQAGGRGCVVFVSACSTASQYSVVPRSTFVYNSIHSRRSEKPRLSFASPCAVLSSPLPGAAPHNFPDISFASSARFRCSALSSEAIYPPSPAARANPASGCRNQSSASMGYGRFRAYPCVGERACADCPLARALGCACGVR